MNSARGSVRRATHAGSWYTDDARTLYDQLDGWLSKAEGGAGEQSAARAIIAPHAGYSYSGATAAYAYSRIDPSRVKKVFILGPSHHVYLKGCALTGTKQYKTPLYNLPVDAELTAKLFTTGKFEYMSLQTDEDEHSIEMHLPYIAKIMESRKGDYTVVPILVGSLSREKEVLYGELFAPYLADPQNLFVISSDFCHWGRRFSYSHYEEGDGAIWQHIEKLDRMGMDLIEKLDSLAFHNYLKQHRNTICGRHPISVLLCTIEAMDKTSSSVNFKFSHYAQSNQCTSRDDSSVSYAAGTLTISQ